MDYYSIDNTVKQVEINSKILCCDTSFFQHKNLKEINFNNDIYILLNIDLRRYNANHQKINFKENVEFFIMSEDYYSNNLPIETEIYFMKKVHYLKINVETLFESKIYINDFDIIQLINFDNMSNTNQLTLLVKRDTKAHRFVLENNLNYEIIEDEFNI